MRRLILPLLLVTAPAVAQSGHDANAPVTFDARYTELQDKQHRVILSGGVVVHQAEMSLDASQVTVSLTGEVVGGSPQISRMDASGGVVVRRPDQSATGRFAVYDLNRRVITMLGGVVLHQGTNAVNGARLTINLDSGRAVVDGGAVAGGATPAPGGAVSAAPSGRVTGTFSVPQRQQPAPTPSPTPSP